ncbi:hypothetical protein PANT_14c00137 [Moesziomyces antarcticus T-34]|uniref:RTA1-domain-containing protein n=1 Tax=Pseudozyma antarctica (strain T-34) TaxID=1151754 RepID=M9LXG2_PSEA3|nr:hypothetical protein PANT_14c00137 [Moesziomyces antarcticus T-34]
MLHQRAQDDGADAVLGRFMPFEPSAAPAYIFCAINLGLCCVFLFHILRKRDWYALALPTGCLVQAIGYVNKVRFHSNPTFGLYFSGDLFVQIAPVAYLAFNYILLGRIAHVLESSPSITKSKRRLVGISPRWVKTLFVWSDVVTLLVQVAGGLMKISGDVATLGHYIGLIGIGLQLFSYIIYTSLLRRCQRSCPNLKQDEAGCGRSAIHLFRVLWLSSVFIVIRLLYRIIELAPGPDSRISASQACFYLLDALPLVFALAPYTLAWPSRVFPAISFRGRPPVPSGEDTISKLPLTHTPYQHA